MAGTRPREDLQEGPRGDARAANESVTPNGPAIAAHGEAALFSGRIAERIARLRATTPWVLLAGLLLIALVTVLTQAHRYGITIDEPIQQQYGARVLAWYISHGKDTSFLTARPPQEYMPEHGGIFDALVVEAQSHFAGTDPWLTRHIVTGLVGWLGVVAIALCGYELGGSWVALVAALGLWLYPRYYGAIYNNPKDIPAAVSMMFVLWVTLLLVKRWNRLGLAWVIAGSALLGLCLGAATAIRVTALTWYAVLAALVAGWWFANGISAWRDRRVVVEVGRQGVAAGTLAVTWLLATMALWPFIFLNPETNLVASVRVMTRYPWMGLVLYNGVEYLSTRLPADYVPTWLVIGSPPMLLLLGVAGVVIALAEIVWSRRVNPAVGAVALAFALPLASLLLLHPVLYDALRQFLYIIPPLILLAAYGLVWGVGFLLRQRRAGLRWMAAALLAVTIASYGQVVADMAALSPYEYTYFSPLVGGLKGASSLFETDYYGTCDKAAAEWLGQNYRRYTSSSSPTVDVSDLLRGPTAPFLPDAFHEVGKQPDFFIAYTRNNDNLKYPAYRVIHVVAVEGVPLCVVKANPTMMRNSER